MECFTPFRRFGSVVPGRTLGLVMLPLLLAAPPLSAEAQTEASCEANLTCLKSTSVARKQRFSSGPDLSGWQLVTEAGLLQPAANAAAESPRRWRDPVTRMQFSAVPGACYRPKPPTAGIASSDSAELVCIDSYYLGTYEVTFSEYDRFALATGRTLPDDEGWGRGPRPVINVSVYDALNFAKWLSRRTGEHFRLPTETEWEHAARAGGDGLYPWGVDIGSNRANCDGCGSRWDDDRTAPVGSFAPNAWGLHDMVGNVGEWTCSMRDPDPDHSFERCDSIYETRRRVYRNGGWSDDPERLELAFRDWNAAMRRTDDVGFRLLRECPDCRSPRHDRQARIRNQVPSPEVATR